MARKNAQTRRHRLDATHSCLADVDGIAGNFRNGANTTRAGSCEFSRNANPNPVAARRGAGENPSYKETGGSARVEKQSADYDWKAAGPSSRTVREGAAFGAPAHGVFEFDWGHGKQQSAHFRGRVEQPDYLPTRGHRSDGQPADHGFWTSDESRVPRTVRSKTRPRAFLSAACPHPIPT